MSGHDHCEEWISDNGVEYILTGNGDNCCYDASNVDKIPEGSLKYITSANLNATEGMTVGFTSWKVTAAGTVVTFHDQNGSLLFTTPAIPPRPAAIKDAARKRLNAA